MSNQLTNKRILVTGINGQVGRAMVNRLNGRCELVTAARNGADITLDLSDFGQLERLIAEIKPDIVVNPAAYTQVDKAEDEPEQAFRVNGEAPGVLAEACKKKSALLVHYSTDYVFNGRATEPYKESDPTDPINVYGASKLKGEQAVQAVDCRHLIFRTCWVYDAYGRNFPNAILNKAKTSDLLTVVNDQIGTPTSADFIAEVTEMALAKACACGLADSGEQRLYNLKPAGQCSWYEFAVQLVKEAGKYEDLAVEQIQPVASSEFPARAARPSWSVLDSSRLEADFLPQKVAWEDGVSAYLATRYR